MTFEELLETWDGETAVIQRDPESGAWIFVCLHSTRLGPAGGGTRMNVYETPADALLNAMRLSGAMTQKLAVAGLRRLRPLCRRQHPERRDGTRAALRSRGSARRSWRSTIGPPREASRRRPLPTLLLRSG